MKNKTIVLNNKQIQQRINRIAYQIYEDNFEESEIYIVGIARGGFIFARLLEAAFNKICSITTHLVEVTLDKENHIKYEMNPVITSQELTNKVVIVADDVLNSGKTLIYSLRPFLDANIKKIRTALLVDRDHKRYPVVADYVGITLSTTLQEHITVNLAKGAESVVLQ